MNRLRYFHTSVQINQLFTQAKSCQYEEYARCKQKKKTSVDQGTQSTCSSLNWSLKTSVCLSKFWSSVFLKLKHLAQIIHLDYNIMQLKLPY